MTRPKIVLYSVIKEKIIFECENVEQLLVKLSVSWKLRIVFVFCFLKII